MFLGRERGERGEKSSENKNNVKNLMMLFFFSADRRESGRGKEREVPVASHGRAGWGARGRKDRIAGAHRIASLVQRFLMHITIYE